jgi:DNA-binding transcriptional MocR family regulator
MSQLARLRRLDRKVRRRHRRQRLRLLVYLRGTVPVSTTLTRAEYNRIVRLAGAVDASIERLLAACLRSGVVVQEQAARESMEAPPESGPRVTRTSG